jgi:hypothetical protein
MAERIYVSSEDRIETGENNLVNLICKDGRRFDGVEPRRLFPVSRADKYIALLDGEGIEVAQIRDMSDLDPDSRAAVKRSLEDYYLVPNIIRIVAVSEKYGTLRWTVETDRGNRSFEIRNRFHDIKVYPDGRVRVRDSDDNRYTIKDYKELDARSRKLMISDL